MFHATHFFPSPSLPSKLPSRSGFLRPFFPPPLPPPLPHLLPQRGHVRLDRGAGVGVFPGKLRELVLEGSLEGREGGGNKEEGGGGKRGETRRGMDGKGREGEKEEGKDGGMGGNTLSASMLCRTSFLLAVAAEKRL